MLRSGYRRFVTLTAILGCLSLLAINTGCEDATDIAQIKVQERAAWPLFW